jgi:hypothetical protein
MEKRFAIMAALILAFASLTACGGNSSSGGGNSATPVSTATTSPARTVEIPDQPLDVADQSIYFVTVDGVKYSLIDATVQDFLNGGFTLGQDDENREVPPNEGGGLEHTYSDVHMYKDDKIYFSLLTFNPADEPRPLKECSVTSFVLRQASADISTVCNLSVGCSVEDVLGVFGDAFSERIHEINGCYFYGSDTFSGNFAFIIDLGDNTKIASIQIFFV